MEHRTCPVVHRTISMAHGSRSIAIEHVLWSKSMVMVNSTYSIAMEHSLCNIALLSCAVPVVVSALPKHRYLGSVVHTSHSWPSSD